MDDHPPLDRLRMVGSALLVRIGLSVPPRVAAEHDYRNVYVRLQRRLASSLTASPQEWSLLDIGCGYHYPLVLLFANQVRNVSGADVEPCFFRDGRLRVFAARPRGKALLRAVTLAGPRYSWCKRYYSCLERIAGRPLDHAQTQLYTFDGSRLPFDSGCFDAVVSNAVLEHVSDLPRFVSEVSRVLKPGGVVDMLWHNYYSPSGSHLPNWEARPWAHLVGEREPPTGLNRKRPEEMFAYFSAELEVQKLVGVDQSHRLITEQGFKPEGILTGELKTKLAAYSEELLTTRSYLLQGRKLCTCA
jgi:SAM-dependent methyltransferase